VTGLGWLGPAGLLSWQGRPVIDGCTTTLQAGGGRPARAAAAGGRRLRRRRLRPAGRSAGARPRGWGVRPGTPLYRAANGRRGERAGAAAGRCRCHSAGRRARGVPRRTVAIPRAARGAVTPARAPRPLLASPSPQAPQLWFPFASHPHPCPLPAPPGTAREAAPVARALPDQATAKQDPTRPLLALNRPGARPVPAAAAAAAGVICAPEVPSRMAAAAGLRAAHRALLGLGHLHGPADADEHGHGADAERCAGRGAGAGAAAAGAARGGAVAPVAAPASRAAAGRGVRSASPPPPAAAPPPPARRAAPALAAAAGAPPEEPTPPAHPTPRPLTPHHPSTLTARVIAIFAIAAAALLCGLPPLLLRAFQGPDAPVARAARAFSGGVILALSLVRCDTAPRARPPPRGPPRPAPTPSAAIASPRRPLRRRPHRRRRKPSQRQRPEGSHAARRRPPHPQPPPPASSTFPR
jgi:hypothetical protein